MTPTIRAEALFTSSLQPSQHPTASEIRTAIQLTLRTYHGARGCAAACAAEYGEHPETAVARMRWALAEVGVAWNTYAAA
jgi:hypothetical protein